MRYLMFFLCLFSAAINASPRVVTSIAPLQELTSVIMEGVAIPQSIIGPQDSTHHFAFKPSHLRILQQAELVIWIHRHFEAGFARVANILPADTATIELLSELGINSDDGHIWYSPDLLIKSAEIISMRLIEIDPDNRQIYRDNAARLGAELTQWREQTLRRLKGLQPRFITDHAFTSHFGKDLGRTALATIEDQHDSHGGFKDLNRIESVLRQKPAACLVSLENPVSGLAQNLAQKYRLRIVYLDQAPADRESGSSILQRLEQLVSAVMTCL